MQYKNVQNFIGGIFEKDGTEARKADQFLTKLHNFDLDITGRLKSRYGYEYWMDLLEDNSITSSQNIPDVATNPGDPKGFGARIQKILQYTDVAGAKYIVVVCQGKIYVETLENNGRQWSCLTPNFQFEVIDKHLDVVSYLDLLFFNDVAHNVYYYDSQSYVAGQGWISYGNRFIYFAGDTVYFRNYGDFSADFSTLIEDGNVANPEGQEIYDGLNAIAYPYLATLNLGYVNRTGNDDIGFRYYVLDNAKNQRADDKCQVIKFNDRMIAQDYVEFDINSAADILNFAHYTGEFEVDGNLYIMVDDGKIYKINESNLAAELLENDAAFLTAPTNAAGKKQYSVAVSAEGVFVYTVTLPDKTDWYQPAMNRAPSFPANFNNANKNFTFGQYPNFDAWSEQYNALDGSVSNNVEFFKNHVNNKVGNMQLDFRRINYNTVRYGRIYYVSANIDIPYNSSYLPLISSRKDFSDGNLSDAKIKGADTAYPFYTTRRFRASYAAAPYYQKIPYFNWDFYFITDPFDLTKSTFKYEYWFYNSRNSFENADKVAYTYSALAWHRNDDMLDLLGSTYNADHFTSRTVSKVLLLAGLNFDGTLKSRDISTPDEGVKSWRFLIPSGVVSDLVNAMPIIIDADNNVSFGNEFLDPSSGSFPLQRGAYWSINISTLTKDYSGTQNRVNISQVEDDTRFIFYDRASSEYVISVDWRGNNRIANYSDWNANIDAYNSNVCFHIYKQSVDIAGNNQIDKIEKVGTPSLAQVGMNYDAASTLTLGKKLKYYTAFQFFNGTTSPLSPQTFEISVINNTSKVIISNINHEDIHGVDIYDKADIEKIQLYRSELPDGGAGNEWSTPSLIATLEKDGPGIWYYNPVLPPYAADTFEDSADTYAYNPWTDANAITYPAEDIFLHKNRLILVNLLNEVNSNVCGYSDIDRARAIPPDNRRPIESGDGDRLIGGISTGDYAYLFKETKIYGVLGDFPTGQLVDISRTIGTRYKNMKTVYGGVVYFMNDYGVFRIQGANAPENIISERLANYFDKKYAGSIDFDNLKEHGFVDIDVESREIRWFVPLKVEGETEIRNNFLIKYKIEYNYFRTYSYYDNIFDEAYIQNVLTNEYEYLMAGYDGDIFKLEKTKADNNKPIKYLMRTKEFNVGTDVFRKIYKTIEVAGKYLQHLHVSYWIDGVRYEGQMFERRNIRGLDSSLANIVSMGKARRIMIEISGEQLNQPPVEIEEINIGYTIAKGSRF